MLADVNRFANASEQLMRLIHARRDEKTFAQYIGDSGASFGALQRGVNYHLDGSD
jgi:hypothetical protein